MTLGTGFFLLSAGVAGGLVNALAGGATLITFPAMLSAGLPPIIANASNAVAISPGHLIAVVADRGKLPVFSVRLITLMLVATAGGAVGAGVLMVLPERLFTLPVPALIAFATALFAFAPRIQAWVSGAQGFIDVSSTRFGATILGIASVYGGFFGAGLGVILTAALSITEQDDIRTIKAVKNLLATCVVFAAVAIFIAKGMIQWDATLAMLAGAIIGGYAGGFLIKVLPATWVRWFVIIAGAGMTVIYARLYWF